MPRKLSFIQPTTTSEHLLMKDGWELVTVLDVTRVGPDYRWSIVVSREIDLEEDDVA